MSKGRELFYILGWFVALVVCIAYVDEFYRPEVKIYDCSIAEISPDFPPEVKEECRKLRRTII